MSTFFYDSYAIIEYLNDNPRFIHYFEEHNGVITVFNQVEVFYSVLHDANQEKAECVFDGLNPLVTDVTKEVIREAMLFRLQNKRRRFSYADCIGYHVAKRRGIKFLTGDNQFKDFPGVEFVK